MQYRIVYTWAAREQLRALYHHIAQVASRETAKRYTVVMVANQFPTTAMDN